VLYLGDTAAHIRKAQHNERFLQLVQRSDSSHPPTFRDWMVTVAFYIALQYVDSKLATMGVTPEERHPENHADRNRAVAIYLPRPMSRDYFYLKAKSVLARYFPDSERRISFHTVQHCTSLALTRFR